MFPFELSKNLRHTWFIDLDGTVVKHNGYLTGDDVLLPGAKEFWNEIPKDDFIIITTSRPSIEARVTEDFLRINDLRYDRIIFDLPTGERIIVNDIKPKGLKTAISWNIERDKGFDKS